MNKAQRDIWRKTRVLEHADRQRAKDLPLLRRREVSVLRLEEGV